MLENNPQLRELLIQHLQGGQELLFSVEVGDSWPRGAGHFAVEIEHHVLLFHFCEDREEVFVGVYSGCGVGCYTFFLLV